MSLDYEAGATVDVTVTDTDTAGLTAETTATITVNDIGESPTAPSARATTLEVTENVAGDDVSVLDASDPQGDDFTYQVDDDRFEVTDQGVLKLKAGVSLDHETDASVDLVLTATDEHGHVSGETMVTVSVVDVNEAPTVHDEYAHDDITDGAAGAALDFEDIHLESLFSDQDGTDSLFTYTIELTRVSGEHGELTVSLSTETVTYMATAPTVNDVGYEYMAPMEDDAMSTDIGAISFSDPDTGAAMNRGDKHTFSVYDDRFEVTDAGMLQLKAGMVLEEDTEVHVRVTDRYGLSGTATITITIASDEEGDGMGMDNGMDDGMEETTDPETKDPETKEVTFITGKVTGTPTAGSAGEWTVAIVATDDGGDSARAEFDVIVDDGNDAPTAIHLTNSDGTDNPTYQVEVDENASGRTLGTLTVDDIDSPDHPYGQHEWKVDNPKFEIVNGALKLMAGESLDHEAGPVITVMVTVTDMNGDGESLVQPVMVTVNNRNDAPEAADSIGNWWVVVPEDLDADDATQGQWLSFSLETTEANDANPAFTDEDTDGDKLTYSITNGPSWLEINPATGAFTNKAETKASPGRYSVTVRATDEGQDRDETDADDMPTNTDGAYDEITFMIIVAESDDDNEDNHEPEVTVTLIDNGDYDEGSGRVAVATVTVVDNDFALAPHPYGQLGNDGKPLLVNADANNDNVYDETDGHASQFELSETYTQNGNARTWTVYAKATNTLNHETEDDIEFTVLAWNDLNGNMMYDDGEGDDEDINVDVEDVNEAPTFAYDSPTNTAVDNNATLTGTAAGITVVQGQQEDAKTTIYLNLMELWSDPDDGDDTDDLTFARPTANVPWIKVVDFGQWEDVQKGRDREEDDETDGDDTNDDDPTWSGTAPTDDDAWVAIIEIDRMTNNRQTGDGTVTLTATDEGGESGTAAILVDITDENVLIPNTVDTNDDGDPDNTAAVRINGVLREGNGLTMSFNHRLDPDLATSGEPVTVEYTWTLTDPEGTDPAIVMTSYGSPETLMLTQDHVGRTVTASVMYYDKDPADTTKGDIVAAVTGGSTTRTGTVSNAQDAGTANIVLTTSGNVISAEVNLTDEDGIDMTVDDDPDTDDGTPPVYTWESSVNGVGGWSALAGDTDTSDTMVDLGAGGGGGMHYRLVITYQDEGGANERIVSDTIKVGALADPTTPPTVTGSLAVGGTLVVDSGGGSVQWQTMTPNGWVDIPGATGSLTLTNAHEGGTLRALVTYRTGSDVTAVVAATHAEAAGGDSDTTTLEITALANNGPVSVGDHEIEATIDKQATGMPSVITTVEATVDVASLFQDADGDMLTYTSNESEGLAGGNYIRFDPTTGKLLYITDNQNGQGPNDTDGGGNIVVIEITATDPGGGTATSNVNIRLNAPPTEITEGAKTPIEETTSLVADTPVVNLNVQDENEPTHAFGQYEWAVSDDRFKIVPGTDSSLGGLQAKQGAEFLTAGTANAMVSVTVTATEKASGESVMFTVMVEITNNDDLNPDDTVTPDDDPVPGLKDDETGGGDDATDEADDDDNGTDGDQDGGLPLPPDPAMMFEDDLLDEFILAIDDMDIA